MLLLGIDIGTSSVKVAVVDAQTQQTLAHAQYPQQQEAPIIALQPGWAEQHPDSWWQQVQAAIQQLQAFDHFSLKDVQAIGITYQMHGLVLLDDQFRPLRNSIIWCDSRAVGFGEDIALHLGESYCLQHLLNLPGNFTASKLAWVKENEPEIFGRIAHLMLPGDYIALRLTGSPTTTSSALSEGMFWDFLEQRPNAALLEYLHINVNWIPAIQPVFGVHGYVQDSMADQLGLSAGIPVTYKAGDQPNNAFSLNVVKPGTVAANAGTSGVLYAVGDTLQTDPQSRVNAFAHVNHTPTDTRIGTLLCINGVGIANSYLRSFIAKELDYPAMNAIAATAAIGSSGLSFLPFGNGAERMLGNRNLGAHWNGLQFNRHQPAHLYRSVQEGIACAFRYGLDMMRQNGLQPTITRAGNANLFLSEMFVEAFVNLTGMPLECYDTDGASGAAKGAGLGAGIYASSNEAMMEMKPIKTVEPNDTDRYEQVYEQWKRALDLQLLSTFTT